MASRLTELFTSLGKNPKGVGSGVSALIALAGLGYVGTNSVFTGKLLSCRITTLKRRRTLFERIKWSFDFQSKVVIVPSSSTVSVVSSQIPSTLKACTSVFPGSRIPSSTTSEPSRDSSSRQLAAKISKWSTSL